MESTLNDVPFARRLRLLFWNFFKIALFVVGGGYAIILAAEEIFVRKLHWLKDGELLEMLTVIQAIPGLTAGNAAIYVGYRTAGQWGALAALVAVALPSYVIICLVSVGFGVIPMENLYVQGAFIGVRTALSALTIVAIVRLWPKVITGTVALGAALFTVEAVYFYEMNPAILLGAGIAVGTACGIRGQLRKNAAGTESGMAELATLFLLFCWFGLLCFGGGSALMPLYIQELVDARGWLTLHELSDFAAISQVTPGPIGVNLATFLGFRQGGYFGALICTIGLLLPSYLLMQLALRSLARWEESPVVRGIMAGIGPVTVGLMVATTVIYLELSLFTCKLPWGYLAELGTGHLSAYNGPFRLCYGAVPIFLLSGWALYRNRCSIMTAIFSSAALGALLCRI
ncbi:MAG: hypothetical protein HPZ91_12380 [Lentisphaeria bacterium]|nr:hypothetical protein [Lentisphaeria bacterium]